MQKHVKEYSHCRSSYEGSVSNSVCLLDNILFTRHFEISGLETLPLPGDGSTYWQVNVWPVRVLIKDRGKGTTTSITFLLQVGDVPLGPVLSSLLFTLYIQPLRHVTSNADFHIYTFRQYTDVFINSAARSHKKEDINMLKTIKHGWLQTSSSYFLVWLMYWFVANISSLIWPSCLMIVLWIQKLHLDLCTLVHYLVVALLLIVLLLGCPFVCFLTSENNLNIGKCS